MTAFEIRHSELSELSNILDPQATYGFEQHFSSFEEVLEQEHWNEIDEGEPCPTTNAIDDTPQNWYTEYWNFCAFAHQCANLNGSQFREICDYEPLEDFSIWSGHWFDTY